jgi:hypothetical protein
VGPGADHDILALQQPFRSVRECRLNRLWPYKPPRCHDQFRAAFVVESEMRVYESLNHSAFSIPYGRHIDVKAIDVDPELLAAPNIVRDLGRMDDILTWETCDVWAGSPDIPAFNYRDALSSFCKGPGEQL